MAEEKKRFPWWLAVCAVLALPCVLLVGFIETMGRRETLIGRCDRLREGMSYEDTVRVLGRDPDDGLSLRVCYLPQDNLWRYRWLEGPAEVLVEVECHLRPAPTSPAGWVINGQTLLRKSLRVDHSRLTWWHVRHWAEQAYTAIHGPRR